jgi:hypothetical protein
MPHPNLSPGINALIDSRISFDNLRPGNILNIRALDAEFKEQRPFQVRIADMKTDEKFRTMPIFQFMPGEFRFYGGDGRTPVRVRAGLLANAGTAATHVPEFVLGMLGFGGIDIGRDFSFEYVGGKDRCVIAARISYVTVLPYPDGWTKPAKRLEGHLRKVETVRRRQERIRRQRRTRLERALVVRTQNSVYLLSKTDKLGRRTMTRESDGETWEAKLISLRRGHSFEADILADGTWRTMGSSPVVSIEPDPDEEG